MSDDSKKGSVDQKAILFKLVKIALCPGLRVLQKRFLPAPSANEKPPQAMRGLVDKNG